MLSLIVLNVVEIDAVDSVCKVSTRDIRISAQRERNRDGLALVEAEVL